MALPVPAQAHQPPGHAYRLTGEGVELLVEVGSKMSAVVAGAAKGVSAGGRAGRRGPPRCATWSRSSAAAGGSGACGSCGNGVSF